MTAPYDYVTTTPSGRMRRERRVVQSFPVQDRPTGSAFVCPRCNGDGEVALPGRGRGQMNVGGLFMITCPSCKGGNKKAKRKEIQ